MSYMYVCAFIVATKRVLRMYLRGRDSSVGKSSSSQDGDPLSYPSGGLTQITKCMNESGRDYQL